MSETAREYFISDSRGISFVKLRHCCMCDCDQDNFQHSLAHCCRWTLSS